MKSKLAIKEILVQLLKNCLCGVSDVIKEAEIEHAIEQIDYELEKGE